MSKYLGLAESKCAGYDCLKEYVDKPDSNFAWTDTGIRLQGIDPIHLRLWNGYVLNFTSQAWLTPEGFFLFNKIIIIRTFKDLWFVLKIDYGFVI